MRTRPTHSYLVESRRLWEDAARYGRAEQKRILCERAEMIGYSYAGFIRLLDLGARRRQPSDRQKAAMAFIEPYARKVFDLKMSSTFDGKNATYRRAYRSLRAFGEIPAGITEKQIYAAIERLNLANDAVAPHGEVKVKDALDLVEIDFTKSVYLHYNAKGEIFARENHITKKSESRLMIAAAVDVCSRVCWLEYAMVNGESATYVMDILLRAFDEKRTIDESTGEVLEFAPLYQGLPKRVYMDRGAGNKSKEVERLLGKLGIERSLGDNLRTRSGERTTISNKRGRGMVEKLIGDFKKDFETMLWHERLRGVLPPALTLGYLNNRLKEWCIDRNMSFHPKHRSAVRWEMFVDVLRGAEFPPDDARRYGTAADTARVIQRLVQVSPNKWFKAPSWADDGDDLEIVLKGKRAFVYHDGGLTELEPQGIVRREEYDEPDRYAGMALRARMNDELKFLSDDAITLSSLPTTLIDAKNEFFTHERSADEIEHTARIWIGQVYSSKVLIMERNDNA